MKFRKWQSDAYNVYAEHDDPINGCLMDATPGAGKTKAALAFFVLQAKAGVFNRCIVIVPSDNLRTQWANAAHELGINLLPITSQGHNAHGFHGMVLTYHQLENYYQKIAHYCAMYKVMPIFDEIHHAGDKNTWGPALASAFQTTVKQLLLSGTPFRSDESVIPFVKYQGHMDNQGQHVLISRSDYSYPYRRAIEDGVCRPTVFHAIKGTATWKHGKRQFTRSFGDDLKPLEQGRLLRSALLHAGGFLVEMLRQAVVKLKNVRKEYPDAGGLVVAIDKNHAKMIADLLHVISGRKPKIVTSDDTKSHKIIEKFRKTNSLEWIVAVKMISEGVDIPRLRVGVLATNTRTEMFFIQFLGRIVRGRGLAHFFFPADPAFVKIASSIEKQIQHTLVARKDDDQVDLFEEEKAEDETPEEDPVIKDVFTALDSEFVGSDIYFHEQIVHPTGDDGSDIDVPYYQYMDDLKGKINAMVITVARIERKQERHIHGLWINLGKPSHRDSSEKDLTDKLNWITGRLARARSRNEKDIQRRKGLLFQ